jgi:hypothetical protein
LAQDQAPSAVARAAAGADPVPGRAAHADQEISRSESDNAGLCARVIFLPRAFSGDYSPAKRKPLYSIRAAICDTARYQCRLISTGILH